MIEKCSGEMSKCESRSCTFHPKLISFTIKKLLHWSSEFNWINVVGLKHLLCCKSPARSSIDEFFRYANSSDFNYAFCGSILVGGGCAQSQKFITLGFGNRGKVFQRIRRSFLSSGASYGSY